jgi:ribosomal protein S18 acetylase RimI-like enzyme
MSSVWLASTGERDDVVRLLLAFRDWLEAGRPTERSLAASVERLLADPATEYLLARTQDGLPPCGVCQLRYRHSVWTGAPDCWLEDLYVEESGRRRGVGAALVRAACEHALARGARRIELDTNEDNTAAIALYQSLGFSLASKAHGPLQSRDVFMGRPLDGIEPAT